MGGLQSTHQGRGLVHERDLLLLQHLRLLVLLLDDLGVRLFLWVLHKAAVEFDEFLQAVVARLDYGTALLYQLVFGLHLFVEMCDFSGQVGDCGTLVSEGAVV